jgi:hypothetical protein
MATSTWAAKKLEFYNANVKDYIKLLNKNNDKGSSAIGNTLGLTSNEELKRMKN